MPFFKSLRRPTSESIQVQYFEWERGILFIVAESQSPKNMKIMTIK
jgi:hypothetical protein